MTGSHFTCSIGMAARITVVSVSFSERSRNYSLVLLSGEIVFITVLLAWYSLTPPPQNKCTMIYQDCSWSCYEYCMSIYLSWVIVFIAYMCFLWQFTLEFQFYIVYLINVTMSVLYSVAPPPPPKKKPKQGMTCEQKNLFISPAVAFWLRFCREGAMCMQEVSLFTMHIGISRYYLFPTLIYIWNFHVNVYWDVILSVNLFAGISKHSFAIFSW